MKHRLRVLIAVAAAGLLALTGVAACIDGVTPDCTNPSVCAPIEGDAAVSTEAATPAETSPPDAGTPTREASVPDAANAADAADSG